MFPKAADQNTRRSRRTAATTGILPLYYNSDRTISLEISNSRKKCHVK